MEQLNIPRQSGRNLLDVKAIMAIRNLELRAKVIVEGVFNGLHRSPYHGFSVEFTEYRQYTVGDDPKYLDWRLFARSDRYFLKKFEDETNLRCHIIMDQSGSMGFGAAGYSKAGYAATLAASLAYFLYLQRDAIGLLTFGEAVREYWPARYRVGQLRQVFASLEKAPASRETSLEIPLRKSLELLRKRGLVVVVSDFLAPISSLENQLAALRAYGHEVSVFQILDRNEVDFTFNQSSLFHDMESGRDFYVDPSRARAVYLQKFQAHNESLKAVCQKIGASYHFFPTDRSLGDALTEFLRDRSKGAHIARRIGGK